MHGSYDSGFREDDAKRDYENESGYDSPSVRKTKTLHQRDSITHEVNPSEPFCEIVRRWVTLESRHGVHYGILDGFHTLPDIL